MNLISIWLGFLGVCCSEFLIVRSALLKGSGAAKFMLHSKAYWIFIIVILAPLGGMVAAIFSANGDISILPINSEAISGWISVKAILFGAGFTKLLSGATVKDTKALSINDIQGAESGVGLKQVWRWYVTR